MARRRDRRLEKRRAQAARRRLAPSVGGPFWSRLSADWIVGGIIGGVLLIAALVFLFSRVFSGGGGGDGTTTFFTQVLSVAVDPATPNVRLLGAPGGLYRTDGVGDWQVVAGGGGNVDSVVAVPGSPGAFLAAGDDLLQRSDDGGQTWRDLPAALPPAEVRSLAVDPSNPSTMYAFVDGHGLFRSDDAGQSWTLAHPLENASITSLAVKPGRPDTVYAFHTRRGFVRSVDGGGAFAPVLGGVPASQVTDVLTFAAEPATVYAVAENTVYATTDDGGTWRKTGSGLDEVSAIAMARDSATGDLYVADTQGAFYVSRDGGKRWTRNLP